MIKIDCIADLHGHYPKLEGGDLLIVAGDLTATHTDKQWHEFASWMNDQDYQKIVFIAGNHDTMIERWDKEQDEEGYKGPVSDPNDRIEYLCDSGTEFEGLKIWGCPWSLTFPGINPKCCAFTFDTEEEMAPKLELIPQDVDILITHMPARGVLDRIKPRIPPRIDAMNHVGSNHLYACLKYVFRPKLHVFGHIHEAYGQEEHFTGCLSVNASYVNENYEPINKPVRVTLNSQCESLHHTQTK